MTDHRAAQVLPEARLFALLGGGKFTVSAAESCSGGTVARRITSIAGSSDYFLGSIVAYANSAKEALLGVPESTLKAVGAVSPETAEAMARGSRVAFGSDFAVSTTGIAGPGGATARKPVGLVYIALSSPNEAIIEEHHFPGDRAAVVDAAADRALNLLVEAVERYVSTDVAASETTINR